MTSTGGEGFELDIRLMFGHCFYRRVLTGGRSGKNEQGWAELLDGPCSAFVLDHQTPLATDT